MTDDGTFPCPIKWTQQSTLSSFVGDMDARGHSDLIPIEVRQLAGRINFYADQAKPHDALEAFRARLKVGQLCAWALCTDAERTALGAIYDPATVVLYVQWYAAGSGGGINVNEQAYGTGYRFWSIQANGWVPDVDGSGDAYVAWLCAQPPGRAVPGPFPA